MCINAIREEYWRGVNRRITKHMPGDFPTIYDGILEREKKWACVDMFSFTTPLGELDDWDIKDNGNWGSARPDNICVLQKKNIEIVDDNLVICTKKEVVTGLGWKINNVPPKPQLRQYTSGMITSNFELVSEGRYSTIVTLSKNVGGFPAWWFLVPFKEWEKKYSEVDVFERMSHYLDKPTFLTFSTHKGYPRELFNHQANIPCDLTFMIDVIFHRKKRIVETLINGITVFRTGMYYPDPKRSMVMKFNDAVSNFGGKVSVIDIDKHLPYYTKFTPVEYYLKK